MFAQVEWAKQEITAGNFELAIGILNRAHAYPHNLGEGKLYSAAENDIFYWLGVAHEGLGKHEDAPHYFVKSTEGSTELGAAMFYNDQQPDKIFYQGLAWLKLGGEANAKAIFDSLIAYGTIHQNDKVVLDYFAVSLPNLLVFDDDMNLRNQLHCFYMTALGLMGLGKKEEAISLFNKIIEEDSMHFGAISHLCLLGYDQEFLAFV
ncbi:hypothetical protein EZ428_07785 [Pedobacter frigiditerrae]|uniref:Tetratricopeptide repeat protein n=1 Tax=Pedobacter frigiditerrae TaxID=2530452 RepID=A0A4R0MZE3_9SPHI|nr:hypothetical protein [Pedobacter frigiditerrae]TCC91652.1 hypothetical protein EZ428_07785 [Pedobacter frigiditerrae]